MHAPNSKIGKKKLRLFEMLFFQVFWLKWNTLILIKNEIDVVLQWNKVHQISA